MGFYLDLLSILPTATQPFGFELGKIVKYASLNSDQLVLILGRNLARLLNTEPQPQRLPLWTLCNLTNRASFEFREIKIRWDLLDLPMASDHDRFLVTTKPSRVRHDKIRFREVPEPPRTPHHRLKQASDIQFRSLPAEVCTPNSATLFLPRSFQRLQLAEHGGY
jgi:hypothetical protein